MEAETMWRLRFSGVRLKRARLAAGMSQRDLSILLDCAETTISKYESGLYAPLMQRTMQMADVLDVPIEALCVRGETNGEGDGG